MIFKLPAIVKFRFLTFTLLFLLINPLIIIGDLKLSRSYNLQIMLKVISAFLINIIRMIFIYPVPIIIIIIVFKFLFIGLLFNLVC